MAPNLHGHEVPPFEDISGPGLHFPAVRFSEQKKEEMLSPLRCVKHSPMLVRVNSKKSPNQGSESDTRLLETSFSTTSLSPSSSSQENLCKEKIKKNVDKLGRLADRCELVNSNLVKVVDESHKILDNSFLAKQLHLTDHVTNLNYGACLDIGSAISTYSQVRRSLVKFTNPLFK